MATTTLLRDADAKVRKGRDGRGIEFTWNLSESDGRRGKKIRQAALYCGHRKAGMSYFSGRRHGSEFFATLRNQDHEHDDALGFSSTSFMMFDGLGIATKEVGRFSQKGLTTFAEEALAALKAAFADGNEKVTAIFEVEVEE